MQILEPQISILNLDEYEETNISSNILDESQLLQIAKIKQEPKYEGYEDDEDDGFEEVGTFEAVPTEIFEEDSGMRISSYYILYIYLNMNISYSSNVYSFFMLKINRLSHFI